MTVLTRKALVRWLGHPPGGTARVTVGSGSIPQVAFDMGRLPKDPLAAAPTELVAGAFGTVFCWRLAHQLVEHDTPANELVAELSVTLSGDGDAVALSTIECKLSGRVPNIVEQDLKSVAQDAIVECLRIFHMREEEIEVNVEAVLEGD
jgi:organic hydroperoxide reductase OsmC/OhrA